MSDLIEFLRARLDEDEAAARAATPGPWRWGKTFPDSADAAVELLSDGKTRDFGHGPYPEIALSASASHAEGEPWIDVSEHDEAHIARHDPALVLAEVAAKRAIVAIADLRLRENPIAQAAMSTILCHLAAIYASHPDYREEWKP